MIAALSWWLVVQVLGAAAWPLAWRLFGRLPDRGYLLSKPLGFMLVGYVYWLLVSFRFLTNGWVATVFVTALVWGAIWWSALAREPRWRTGLMDFVKAQWRVMLWGEALFALSFGFFASLRAYYPEIMATEKPMELAFLNSVLRSQHFPPPDPWLSGFAISYYYFGYLMMAILTVLSGVPSSVGFNLALVTCFALATTGAFSISYNLVESVRKGRGIAYGFLGAGLVTLMGNLEGVLEVLHARGLGGADLWNWLDIKGLAEAPVTGLWWPAGNWWWWRASRVIRDVVLGVDSEVINEFPLFSFIIGDLHPHVLSLPFVFLALALSFNALRGGGGWNWREGWRGFLFFAFIPLCLGALGFLNTWDFPIHLLIFALAYGLGCRMRQGRAGAWWIGEAAVMGAVCLALGVLFYLPFYVGFRSQAGGLALNLLVKTRLHQYLIMFGPFVYVVAGLLVLAVRGWSWWGGEPFRGKGLVFLSLTALAMGITLVLGLWVSLLLIGLGFLGFLGLWYLARANSGDDESLRQALCFALLLALVGIGLTLACEFVFIRDTFNSRMNTVFKFYYQAWIFLALASSFALFQVLEGPAKVGRIWLASRYLWLGGATVLLAGGLVYTVAAIHSRTQGFAVAPTLDGLAYLRELEPGEYEAVSWLNNNVAGSPIILESVGGSYSAYGRVSARTGLPTVLGWGGHELQWRGNYDEPGRREPDVETIYSTTDTSVASFLLDKYGVAYVYIGYLERARYPDPMALKKFSAFMDVVYDDQGVTIYKRR